MIRKVQFLLRLAIIFRWYNEISTLCLELHYILLYVFNYFLTPAVEHFISAHNKANIDLFLCGPEKCKVVNNNDQ